MAGRYNMFINQGSTFNLTFTISTDGTPWALVGNYTARMTVKRFPNSTSEVVQLTTENGRITFASEGVTTLQISAVDSENLPDGKWYYDLEFENNSGVVTRILEGRFIIKREITNGN